MTLHDSATNPSLKLALTLTFTLTLTLTQVLFVDDDASRARTCEALLERVAGWADAGWWLPPPGPEPGPGP